MNTNKKGFLKYIAVALALALMVGCTVSLIQMNANATAEDAQTAATTAPSTTLTSPFTDAVAAVRDSVVGVDNYGKSSNSGYYFGYGYGYGNGGSDEEVLRGSGSGVVIATGYVLTNYHVVEDATSLKVTASDDSDPLDATLVGYDSDLDIAILKVDGLTLPAVTLGDSDTLRVGDWAICIGNPLSFTGTTTVGVISALGREISDYSYDRYGRRTEITNDMIQTDAAINSGNSGGGLFSVAGELMGIPSMKFTSSGYSGTSVEGIGMAVPINSAKPLIEQVLSGKTVSATATDSANSQSSGSASIAADNRPRIGVTVRNMNTANPAVSSGILPTGAYVDKVESGSPAEAAGIQAGDIIVEIDGTVITGSTQMVSLLQAKNAGDTVQVKVYRVEGGLANVKDYNSIPDGEYIDLTVSLAMLDNVQQ